ncbi:zinc ABC transporter substrate-binding protein [Deltaproteobacteria bacterium TL4]
MLKHARLIGMVLAINTLPALLWGTPIEVTVSILPQKFFVEKIGGSQTRVNVMVGPGSDPHTFEPTPKQMIALSHAQLYFAIGIEFEKIWLAKFQRLNPQMRIIHTDQGIEKLPGLDDDHEHSENESSPVAPLRQHPKEASPHGEDPHIWLSPLLVQKQAQTIFQALIQIDPAHQTQYTTQSQHFQSQLVSLHEEFTHLFSSQTGQRAFLIYHPVLAYFAKDYGLTQHAIEIEGKQPKPAQLQRLIDYAKDKGLHLVVTQPQFDPRSGKMITTAIGGKVLSFDPLAEAWDQNLRKFAQTFHQSFP